MGFVKWFKNKRWFFRFYVPSRVIEEVYFAIPKEEWAILESVEGFCPVLWMLMNVNRDYGNRHKRIKRAVKVVRVALEMARFKLMDGPLTKDDIVEVCGYILESLFYE